MGFVVMLTMLGACGSSGSDDATSTGNAPPVVPPPTTGPTVGEHAIVYQEISSNGAAVVTTPAMSTMPSGSIILVSVGRGYFPAFEAPTDNKGGVYDLLGTPHTYTEWPNSGTALYIRSSGEGGAGHTISNTTPTNDEITLAAVEVYGTRVADFAWNEVLLGSPITSGSVTVSSPATLVAFWWGDGYAVNDQIATPDGDFTVIESVLAPGDLVQCAVAVARVESAGTYDVTWTSTPDQGAQMWLVAIAD